MQNFSKKEAISFGWESFKANWGFLVSISLFAAFLNFAPVFLSYLPKDLSILATVGGVAFWIIQMVVAIGITKIYLLISKNQPSDFPDLFGSFRLFFRFLLGTIASSLIIFVGLILFIIPGIILAVRLSFWAYALVESDLGPIEAIKESWRITEGHTINLFIFNFLLGLLNVLGFLALFAGLLLTVPMTRLASVYVFRKLAQTTSTL
ncbi:hypothetical protein HYZ70_02660 [Candidatus Curtissbacteria bacterium]|nr:hypothetical protein [Candidatus Curtissbacteria bacterium]